ncbi:glutamate receptor ionotropic, kainate 3-like [Mercenaria mercenaria]|uniref:glutamate receptor ionotropic, kainate 3-like n=1 Tax=Mercenaria mercenaria TaxID=6596 RepID=UPI00234EA9B7|nr:glutamate receptor ionotropic, kainate 3-like [Mercenaria mercenaria]
MAAYNICVISVFVIFGLLNVINAQIKKDISVVTIKQPPFLYKDSDGQYTGYFKELLENVAQIVGFNYTLYESPDGKYGSLENGSWTGMMKEIEDGKADIGGLLTVTHARSITVDFSYPVQYMEPTIVMKRPAMDKPSLQENLAKLLTPLEFSVWLMSFLALLVTGTVLYIISHFNPYEWRRMAKDREATLREAESFTCLNSFFFVVSTLMWQGYVRAPRSVGARVVVVAWWSFTVVLLLSYTASLTNYLRSAPAPFAIKGYSKIRSFRDLAANDEIRVGILPYGATEVRYKTSKSITDKKIYDKIVKDWMFHNESGDIPNTLDELESYLRQRSYSDYALILESPTAKYITNKEPCDLYMVRGNVITSHQAFGMKKGFTLKEAIDLALLKLHHSGKLGAIEHNWFSSQCKETVYQMDDEVHLQTPPFNALDLGTFSSALLIIVAGIVLGGLIAIIEICIYKWAETRVDEDEVEPISNRNSKVYEAESGDRLLNQDSKKGGATQV